MYSKHLYDRHHKEIYTIIYFFEKCLLCLSGAIHCSKELTTLKKAIQLLVAVSVMMVACVSFIGCGGSGSSAVNEAPPPSSEGGLVQVDGYSFQLRTLDEQPLSLDSLRQLAIESARTRADISFAPTSSPSSEVDPAFWVGKYWCKIHWDKHYVGDCIKRDCWHLNLLVNDSSTGKEVFNAHLCGWWQNGPQFGIYNSASGYCKTTRGKFTDIKNAIQQCVQNALPWLPVWAAVAIAYTTAYTVVPALGLAW